MVECTVFKWFFNSKSEFIPFGHMRKMSSMNLSVILVVEDMCYILFFKFCHELVGI